LAAGVTPVAVGSALAFHEHLFLWQPAAICLVFALLAQIISNFANDYFDYKKGTDNKERLGPPRAVAEGWIAPQLMLSATLGLIVFNSLIGLSLLFYGGWILIPVGVAVALFAVAYSGGPYPLAYHGWGDICVFVFFGIIPVGFTYYVQVLQWTLPVTICGTAVGLVIINILVANNYRDRFSDANSRKMTTIVLFGEKFGSYFYLVNGIAAVLCCQYFWCENSVWATLLPLVYLFFHYKTWKKMIEIGSGKQLIEILERTAKNVLIFGLALSIGLMAR
jgi:1,4-dihydroxy-2-naphthoate octaprenyltransferase